MMFEKICRISDAGQRDDVGGWEKRQRQIKQTQETVGELKASDQAGQLQRASSPADLLSAWPGPKREADQRPRKKPSQAGGCHNIKSFSANCFHQVIKLSIGWSHSDAASPIDNS